VRDDLRTYLLADSTLAALVGTRIYPGSLDQGCTLPAVAMWTISRGHDVSLSGVVEAGEARIQLDAHAATRAAADAVAAAIVARLKTLSAACPTTIGDGTAVCDVDIEGPRDDHERPADGSADWEYISSLDALLTIG